MTNIFQALELLEKIDLRKLADCGLMEEANSILGAMIFLHKKINES